jgi:hypothetical protein
MELEQTLTYTIQDCNLRVGSERDVIRRLFLGDPVCRHGGSLDVRLPTRHDNNDTATLSCPANFDMESSHPLHHALETFKYHAKDLLSAISGCVCQQQSKLKINGRMCACFIPPFHIAEP